MKLHCVRTPMDKLKKRGFELAVKEKENKPVCSTVLPLSGSVR